MSLLGKGGMGEVYRARDTQLDRDVAVKVLLNELSQDPTFKQRFEREAKTISQLQHPNVCTLYGVGSDARVDYRSWSTWKGRPSRIESGAGPSRSKGCCKSEARSQQL